MNGKRVYSKPNIKELGSLKSLIMAASGQFDESGPPNEREN